MRHNQQSVFHNHKVLSALHTGFRTPTGHPSLTPVKFDNKVGTEQKGYLSLQEKLCPQTVTEPSRGHCGTIVGVLLVGLPRQLRGRFLTMKRRFSGNRRGIIVV